MNNQKLTGSLPGASPGKIVSTILHKEPERTMQKATKTGLFATSGFLIGGILENWVKIK